MAECFICGRSGRGLAINRGTFHEHFCSMDCMDAAYAVIKRGGVPRIAEHYPAALAQAIDAGGAFIQQVGSTDLSTYTEEQAQDLVDSILHSWQKGCYTNFCQANSIPISAEYTPKPPSDTDKQYARTAKAVVGQYLQTLPSMDLAQLTQEQVQQFCFTVIEAVRHEAATEIPF